MRARPSCCGCRTAAAAPTTAATTRRTGSRARTFPYLAANVINDNTHLPLLAPVWIKDVGGAKIGFIGMTLKDTPNIVTASGVAGLTFKDEVQTANFYAKLLKLAGVNAIVDADPPGRPAGQLRRTTTTATRTARAAG